MYFSSFIEKSDKIKDKIFFQKERKIIQKIIGKVEKNNILKNKISPEDKKAVEMLVSSAKTKNNELKIYKCKRK